MPLLERVRVEVYLPDPHVTEYDNLPRSRCMSTENIKDEARRLLDRLPEDITWDQLIHEIYVRQSIEAGLAASKAGKIIDVAAVRGRFRLQ